MALATTFLNPLDASVAVNRHTKEIAGFNKSVNLKSRQEIHGNGLTVNCVLQEPKLIDNNTTSLVDSIIERATAVPTPEAASDPHMSTLLVHYTNKFDPFKATSTPIYQTATFKMPSATHGGEYMYSRTANPTRDTLEKLLAKLDNAKHAYCFNSGMSALTAVSELVKPGYLWWFISIPDGIYCKERRSRSKVSVMFNLLDVLFFVFFFFFLRGRDSNNIYVYNSRINTSNLDNVKKALERRKTKLVWLESPSNPQLKISDLRKISALAHEYGAIVLVDNSMMSPILSQPLDLGVDIVMHSATKFISGNSNCTAGVVVTNDDKLSEHLNFYKNAMGCALAPFDSWLCLEGVKTMDLRVMKKEENTKKVADYLKTVDQVTNINYVGFSDFPGHDLHFTQAKGAGSVLSFNTTSAQLSKFIVEHTKYFSMTVGFGSIGSAICLPWFTSHASIPVAERESMGLSEDLVRISVGIEDADDLVEDLKNAFKSFLSSNISFWF